MNSGYDDCIEECLRCALACESCASACLQEQDTQMMANCIKLDRDCADMCKLAAMLMARQSPLAKEFCALCAKACKACGDECGKHDDDHCQNCAKACHACAQACEAMAA
ncbi:four-helix bundle copper-binding protein [Pseudomonas sp. Marseille-Q5115]|uniref:four-helix bundle copper-binding protein n=1 Tax=Pseudomonas sp. Marseille-Q5115 TaxID=2866593 RepID=UPI001CE4A35C|nr:four-helix bundle copper-binding protein [Pseudomonas sp. Marseille-Q5115]